MNILLRWFCLALLLSGTVFQSRAAETEAWPVPEWEKVSPAEVGMDSLVLATARDYALTAEGSGYITRHGKLVMSWGDPRKRVDLKSSTKSFGSLALGLALDDGRIQLEDLAIKHHPRLGVPPEENSATGWLDEVTIKHLASQTAGFEKRGGYTPQLFRPGTLWDYSDSGPNWLSECLTLLYREDLDELMFKRVFTPIGITREDLTWRQNLYRPPKIEGLTRREFGAGIHANVDAMARVGLLMLRRGRWQQIRVLSEDFVDLSTRPLGEFVNLPVHKNSLSDAGPEAPRHYGLLWWTNADGSLPNVPRDAYWSWGLYDSLIFVVPSLDLVVSRTGKSWERKPGGKHYDPLASFFNPIIAAGNVSSGASHSIPKSNVISNIKWAPVDAIRRSAKGSDNWPLTWAGDGH